MDTKNFKRIALASSNAGKVREFKNILAKLPYEIVTQEELDIVSCVETGATFVENAIIKARHVAMSIKTNLPVIADDSGLVVDALNGLPGIFSARYAGETATMADNIAKLLHEMRDVPVGQRTAHFYCVIVLLRCAKDPAPLICQGKWAGEILTAPRGKNGFGYDPVFWVPTHSCSAAELPAEIKNSISHRALALKQLIITSY
jgi:XTP/dITP diphosphohydrolase